MSVGSISLPRTPNPVDQWLEARGYYRKHTARDPSSLFRVVSEQMFLTQRYFEKVREDCVRFISKNKHRFEQRVEDFVAYLNNLASPDECGGPLEIEALSLMYSRDMVMFERLAEPVNVTEHGYDKKIMYFYSEHHYDSVFKKEYIQNAAFCQSLAYELLYSSVFKLPDMRFAVSQMLHESPLELQRTECLYRSSHDRRRKAIVRDAEWYDSEKKADPSTTNCILSNSRHCMFHLRGLDVCVNEKSEDRITSEEANANQKTNDYRQNMHSMMFRSFNAFPDLVANLFNLADFYASDPNISCVKQILRSGFTPFPYKVAKALEPDIYRNIEFDVWNEIRRELRYGNWYNGGATLQVGVKCLVKLSDTQLAWYHCHIQDMPSGDAPCLVFIEELGEKKIVPRDSLQPLPLGEAKPWAFPYRKYRNFASRLQGNHLISITDYYNGTMKKRSLHSRRNKDAGSSINSERMSQFPVDNINNKMPDKENIDVDYNYHLHASTATYHGYPISCVYTAMPVNITSENGYASDYQASRDTFAGPPTNYETENPTNQLQPSANYMYPYSNYGTNSYPLQQQSYIPGYAGPSFYPGYPAHNGQVSYSPAPVGYYSTTDPNSSSDNSSGMYAAVTPNTSMGTYIPVPPPGYGMVVPYQPNQMSSRDSHVLNEMNNRLNNPVDFASMRSQNVNGSDLPYNDVPTLRFFYNLGHDYFRMTYMVPNSDRVQESSGALALVGEESTTSSGVSSSAPSPLDNLTVDLQRHLRLDSDTVVNSGGDTTLNYDPNKQQVRNRNGSRNARENKRGYNGSRYNKRYDDTSFAGGQSQDANINRPTRNIKNRALPPVSQNSKGADKVWQGSEMPSSSGAPIEPAQSPYMMQSMAYTPVPGMYSQLVPCYPIETENGASGFYVAQYMGVPFGVVPTPVEAPSVGRSPESVPVVADSAHTAVGYQQQMMYQPQPSAPVSNASTGYYQNQMWYPTTPAHLQQPASQGTVQYMNRLQGAPGPVPDSPV